MPKKFRMVRSRLTRKTVPLFKRFSKDKPTPPVFRDAKKTKFKHLAGVLKMRMARRKLRMRNA